MYNFIEIMERVKDELSKEKNGRIIDGDVANSLGIERTTYSSRKKRGSVPYEEILLWCLRKRVNPTYIIFGFENIEKLEKER